MMNATYTDREVMRQDFHASLTQDLLIEWVVLFSVGWLSYQVFYNWNKKLFPDYRYNTKRMYRETVYSIWVAFFDMLKIPIFGLVYSSNFSKMYFRISDYGWGYFFLSIAGLIVWTETFVYWSHVMLHTPFFFRMFHCYHHTSMITTSLTAFAFHPIDAFLQAWPFLVYPLLFPIHYRAHTGALLFIKLWTIFIHDDLTVWENKVVLSARYHTIHHTANDFNFGQVTQFWDRWMGTLSIPAPHVSRWGPFYVGSKSVIKCVVTEDELKKAKTN